MLYTDSANQSAEKYLFIHDNYSCIGQLQYKSTNFNAQSKFYVLYMSFNMELVVQFFNSKATKDC